MPFEDLKLTRRQALAATATASLYPLTNVIAQQQTAMRGTLMILSTPFTFSGAVDYEDLANEVAFIVR